MPPHFAILSDRMTISVDVSQEAFMNRRQTLAGLALAAAAPLGPAIARNASKTYLFVHGTWLGGWMWRRLADILIREGHRVFTPTMTGCGERVHLSRPEVGLETHIQDVCGVIEAEELEDVILVGHSFAGITVTGAADRMRERIRRVVFFDALIPTKDRLSAVPRDPDGTFADYFEKRVPGFIDGYKMDFFKDYPIDMLLPADHPEAAHVRRRITTHPMRQWTDSLDLKNGGWEGLRPMLVEVTRQIHSPSSERMLGPARGPGWEVAQLATSRMGPFTDPERAADVFRVIG
jgi:pimeloyl-ACP methyl ester carboxylesterase